MTTCTDRSCANPNYHRPPARRAADVRRDRALAGARRGLDLAAPRQSPADDRVGLIPDDWTLDSLPQLVHRAADFWRWLGNSLLVSAAVTVTGVALASIGGYAFSRFRFVGRQAMMLSILTTQMFPATMLLLAAVTL